MRDDLEIREAIHDAAEREPRHGHRRLVGPAEVRVDEKLRLVLAGVVDGGVRAPWMQQNRPVVRRHAREDRQKLRRVEWPAGDVREDFDAEKAERVDGPFGFRDCCVDVRHRQARAGADEAVGVCRDQGRQFVIGDARARHRVSGGGDAFDIRPGDRENLPHVRELVHDRKAQREVRQAAIGGGVSCVLRREAGVSTTVAFLQVARREQVGEDVDFHVTESSRTLALMNRSIVLVLVALSAGAGVAQADTADRLLRLVSVPGVAGYESAVREAIEMLLPAGARVRADSLGNILIRTGNGSPHTLIVAPLDEPGVVVSAITDDGYLRVHQHTPTSLRLSSQFFIGQPVQIQPATGTAIPGVAATPSVHLSAFRDAQAEARVKTIDDIWIDVGAGSRADVEKAGIRLLDSVSLTARATRLAGAQVSGVAAASRAAAMAVAEIIRRSPGRGATGSVSLAWVTQSEFGNRGLLRMLETLQPDRLVVLRPPQSLGEDPFGATGRLGGGPVVGDNDSTFDGPSKVAQAPLQTIAASRWRLDLPDSLTGIALHLASVPVRYGKTPVETVDARDVDALAALVAAWVGLPPLGAPETSGASDVSGASGASGATRTRSFELLTTLTESYGVSGHEEPVRNAIVKSLPAWCKPSIDERGNVVVSFGSGEKELLFVAHMDEVGLEIAGIGADGTATVRTRGGMYLSVYEGHPIVVLTSNGPVAAVLAPRLNYAVPQAAQPTIDALRLYFGTSTAEETTQLGVAPGQSATVRKTFVPLGAHRATARSMDDRNGATALLLALATIDPANVQSRVTFAWTVEEETGLGGATHLAKSLSPETAFAIDTFVSSDTPVDGQRLAGAPLGRGAVLRVL